MTATSDTKIPRSVSVEVKIYPNIEQGSKVMCLQTWASWMDPTISYIRDRIMPVDKRQVRTFWCQAARYILIDGLLYRWGYTWSLLRCLTDEEADYVLKETHKRVCGNQKGIFLPTIHQETQEKIRSCKNCQSSANVPTQLLENLTSMTSPWPLAQWVVDLIKPLPKG